jgi:malate dehydrogenase (oxaloacetate-decarboxylating)
VISAHDRVTQAHVGGKMTMVNAAALTSRDDLSMAYTPGVARVCMAIHHDEERTWDLTIRGNSVAVITDGSNVVGQGDLGPLAALPAAEAKCMFLREMAGVDGFPLPLDEKDPDKIVATVARIVSVFAGVHITDMAAPKCFEIQDKLREVIDIPVMHDMQGGTAAAILAALINALELAGKSLADATVVIAGLGPSGVATARLLEAAGVGEIITCHRGGALHAGTPQERPELQWIADNTNPNRKEGSVKDLVKGADVFIGLSVPGVIDADDITTMADKPIILALAMPIPDVSPEAAAAGGAFVYGTGRPDLPNQISSTLAFPGIWRGALDCRAKDIDRSMIMAAAKAIAASMGGAVGQDHVIPSVFDPQLVPAVAKAVREAAEAAGLARITAAV